MVPKPLSRRASGVGGACALAVPSIWTSFILVARSSATRALMSVDSPVLRYLCSGWVCVTVGLRPPADAPQARVVERAA